MSGKYDSIENYNLSYENFIDAINEFDGFVTGLSNNTLEQMLTERINQNIFLSNKDNPTKKDEIAIPSNDEDLAVSKEIGKYLLDRTTGTYFLDDLNNLAKFSSDKLYEDFLILTGYFKDIPEEGSKGLGSARITKNKAGSEFYNITDALKYKKGDLKEIVLLNSKGEEQKNQDGTLKMVYDVSGSFDEEGILTTISGTGDNSVIISGFGNANLHDRFNPNIAACVCLSPNMGIMGTNKSHLSIFFNLIPKIEMSKCVPYIDITILSENYGNKTMSNMNVVNVLRFEKDKYGKFTNLKDKNLNDDNTSDKRVDNLTRTYMDVFTTPQTFSNADVNSSSRNISDMYKTPGNSNNDMILEPIMPLMTLDTLTVSVRSAGYGLMSSKAGSLSLKLHDRSRLKDITSLLSVEEFATTKIIVEYGWNHPQGGVNSDNVIAKYLNGLKERSIFQVVGSDYSFSGNIVDINVKLTAYGYRQTDKVHAGCGPSVPLNILSDLIKKVADDIIASEEGKETIKEVRQKVKINSSNSRSITSTISWEQIRKFSTALNGGDNSNILGEIKNMLLSEENGLSIDDKEGVIKGIYGKLAAITDQSFPDPFVTSLVKGTSFLRDAEYDNQTAHKALIKQTSLAAKDEEYVTLGNVITKFIAHPMASTCMYDEVQVVFYPLNHHAGHARIHTTASFPINIKQLYDLIDQKIKENSHMSVKRFFSLLEKEILNDKNSRPYGFADLDTLKKKETLNKVSNFVDKTYVVNDLLLNGYSFKGFNTEENTSIDGEILKLAKTTESNPDNNFWINKLNNKAETETTDQESNKNNTQKPEENKQATSEEAKQKLDQEAKIQKRYGELYQKYVEDISDKYRKEVSEKCSEYYKSDGLNVVSEAKFVKPNFSLDFEVIPVIQPQNNNTTESSWWKKFTSIYESNNDVKNLSGLYSEKSILRIHVYDELAIQSPQEYMILNSLVDGVKTYVSENDTATITKLNEGFSFYDMKQIVKSKYPTIIFGSENSLVNSISSQANTSGQLSNVLMVESYGDLKKGKVKAHNDVSNFEEITILPNNITIQCAGIPTIGRGNSIFVDFGTNTSLDNVYTVKDVSHSISKGGFTTNISLSPVDQQTISNFKNKMVKSIDAFKSNTKVIQSNEEVIEQTEQTEQVASN